MESNQNDKMNKITEFYRLLSTYQYGKLVNGKKITNTDNFDDYRTISPEDFHKYKVGICWDYAEAEARFFSKLGFKLALNESLADNSYSLYFVQYESKNGYNPTHTWLAFKYEGKVYTFEVSWGSEKGIKQWNSEKLMVNTYFKKHMNGNHEPKQPLRYLMIKYGPRKSFGKNVAQYMNSIYKTGYVINSNIPEANANKHVTINEAIEFVPMNQPIEKYQEPINIVEQAKIIGIDTTFLETDYLEESAKSDYDDALSIYNQLSDKEKKFAVPSGRYVDSSYLIARALSYSNGKPVGFADACDFKHVFGNSKHAIITTIAILPDYRNKNIAEKLISNLNKKLKGKYDNMIWKCNKANIASSKCAQKLGFTLYKQSKTEFTYIKKVD